MALPTFLKDILVQHVARYSEPTDPTAYVFTAPGGGPGRKAGDGGPIRANFRKRAFADAVAATGLDEKLTPHDLRDTAATLAFQNGASVKEVQRMLGHKKAAVTLDRYTGVLGSMEEATSDALDATFRRAQKEAQEQQEKEATVTEIVAANVGS